MKVFANKLNVPYGGGLILVAANSKEEAHRVYHKDERYDWMWCDFGDTADDFYYQPGDWIEIPMLTADVDAPRVIIEDSHKE